MDKVIRLISPFFSGLGFLTRLAPARVLEDNELARTMAWLPAIGGSLGLVIALPFWMGLGDGLPWVQAWIAVILNVYLTRGLHLDGLSDVLDGSASHVSPEKFWEIVKDSRIGAFGSAGMILALLGQVILFQAMFAQGWFGGVIWCLAIGRMCAVVVGFARGHTVRPGLGRTFMRGATPENSLFALIVTLILGFSFAPASAVGLGLLFAALVLIPLIRLSKRVGAVNGDFLGAAIVLGELASGISFAIVI